MKKYIQISNVSKTELLTAINNNNSYRGIFVSLGCNPTTKKELLIEKLRQENIDLELIKTFGKKTIVGQKFNFLTVLSSKNGTCECLCDCGTKIEVNDGYVREKGHCGCKTNEDLSGQKIGLLSLVKKTKTHQQFDAYECVCECGNKCIVAAGNILRRGKRVSCGCLTDIKPRTKQYQGIGDLSGLRWSAIQSCQKRKSRDLEFTITIEYAWNLFIQQNKTCALTGLPIKICDIRDGGQNTASLDRIDSSKGYIEGNVQWVHKDINHIKMDYNQEYFLNLCKRVYENSKDHRTQTEIPSWTDYFLGICFATAERSPDSQTKIGCVITDRNNHILGTGYNGFPKHFPEEMLPNTRPEKYQWIIHAEENAIINSRDLHLVQDGAIAYISSRPCLHCLKLMINSNIKKIIVSTKPTNTTDIEQQEHFELLITMSGIEYEVVSPKLDFLANAISDNQIFLSNRV